MSEKHFPPAPIYDAMESNRLWRACKLGYVFSLLSYWVCLMEEPTRAKEEQSRRIIFHDPMNQAAY